jgi:condensation domain-containing protein
VRANFSGGRAGEAPLTWGQGSLWAKLQRDPGCSLNYSRVLTVKAGGITVAAAAAAIGRVIERHESLRTRLRPGTGTVSQIVSGSGSIPIAVTESRQSALDADTAAAVADFLGTRFDYYQEFPLRARLLTVAGEVRAVVLNFAHIAADGGGAAIVLRDLESALAGRALPAPPAMAPLDLAREQRQDRRKQTQRAAKYWASQYQRIPATMFPLAGAPQSPPRQQAVLTSPALPTAARMIAAATGASTSNVLLAATCTLAGVWTGNAVSAMHLAAHNRIWPGHRDLVANLVQLGLFVLDLDGGDTFPALVQRTSAAALKAYRYAYYDERAIDRVRSEAGDERGTVVNPFCCFNDMRDLSLASDKEEAGFSAAGAGLSEREMRDSLARTAVDWMPYPAPSRCRFCLQLVPAGSGFGISLTADTRYLPRASIEQFLRGLETLLVAAAHRDVRAAEVGAILRTAR